MKIISALNFLSEYEKENENSFEFYTEFPMSSCCSFKIGGNALLAVFPLNSAAFEKLLTFLDNEAIPYKVIGNGTNIIPPDTSYEKVLIITKKISSFSFENNILKADCGASLTLLSKKASSLSLKGMEDLCGIPATIGGAIYMNSGAYSMQISDILKSCKCYNHSSRRIEEYTNEEMHFSYRNSRCHDEPITVISAEFELTYGDKEKITERMREVVNKRKAAQPLSYPNAGSIFKRPLNDFAGRLIDVAGLKGYKIGGAEVSQMHAGFIINRGNATAKDVKALIEHIKKTVYDNSNVMLECEVEFI